MPHPVSVSCLCEWYLHDTCACTGMYVCAGMYVCTGMCVAQDRTIESLNQ